MDLPGGSIPTPLPTSRGGTGTTTTFGSGRVIFAGLTGTYSGDAGLNYDSAGDVLAVGTSAGGAVSIAMAAPGNGAFFRVPVAATAIVTEVERLSIITSGTAAAGFGLRQTYEAENGSGTQRIIGALDFEYTVVTNAAEESNFVVRLIIAGTALSEVMRFKPTGMIIPANRGIGVDSAFALADQEFRAFEWIDGVAGAALALGETIYLAVADSRWEKTDANAVGTAGSVLVGVCILAAAGDGSPTRIMFRGLIRADSLFPTFTVSAPVYLSAAAAGAVVNAAPSGTDDVVRIVGHGLDGNTLFVNVSPEWETVV